MVPRMNHPLHIVLTLLTGGLWLPVYGYVAWRNGKRRDLYERGHQAGRLDTVAPVTRTTPEARP